MKLPEKVEKLARDLRDLLILAEQKKWEIESIGDYRVDIGESHCLYCDLTWDDAEDPFIIKGPNEPTETELT